MIQVQLPETFHKYVIHDKTRYILSFFCCFFGFFFNSAVLSHMFRFLLGFFDMIKTLYQNIFINTLTQTKSMKALSVDEVLLKDIDKGAELIKSTYFTTCWQQLRAKSQTDFTRSFD